MRRMNSLPLNDDLIDRILVFLPDYASLQATILSSKSFYNIFKLHRNSIIRGVSYNLTGPALPSAVRLLRYSGPAGHYGTPTSLTSDPKPWSEEDPISPITNEECRKLAENAAIVKALEDLFSLRHKDRISLTSALNAMESWRFRRAMFRLMLFADIFSAEKYRDLEFEDDEDTDENIAKVNDEKVARQNFLNDYANYELFEMHSVSLFLLEVIRFAKVGYDGSGNYSEDFLACRPQLILEAYQKKNVNGLMYEMDIVPPVFVERYLSEPLKRIWDQRKTKLPPTDSTHWSSLLDDVQAHKDTCNKCGGTYGFDLWNENNWDQLANFSDPIVKGIGRLDVYRIPLAKGNLDRNAVDGQAFKTALNSSTFGDLLNKIHQIRIPAWDTWDKGDWLCEACISEILGAHLHLWYLERKRENGELINEDCWYGYKCTTQLRTNPKGVHHAGRLNHFCEPSRTTR